LILIESNAANVIPLEVRGMPVTLSMRKGGAAPLHLRVLTGPKFGDQFVVGIDPTQ
jgi:hypothetical protein